MIPDIHKPLISQMTWYQSQNYGTVLQAYALQRTLNDIGADARLVNYDPAPWQQRNQSRLGVRVSPSRPLACSSSVQWGLRRSPQREECRVQGVYFHLH